MPTSKSIFIDIKTIIINLLNESKETCLSDERLRKLLSFIYDELKNLCKLKNYQICFDVDSDVIERVALYNNDIFILDIDGEQIYLRKGQDINSLAQQYKVDGTIQGIIKKFKD